MFDGLFPAGVWVTGTNRRLIEIELSSSEHESIRHAVEKRRQEFVTVRACARASLRAMGMGSPPIPKGPLGAPVWPVGVVGSMSHCDGYRVAAVARASEFATLGLDVEPNLPLQAGVLEMIGEGAFVAPGPWDRADHEPAWDRLAFCSKEAALKAWCQLSGISVPLADIALDLAVDGTFTAQVTGGRMTSGGMELPALTGRWAVHDGFVGAATSLAVISRGV